MRTCLNCGTEAPDDAITCLKCGRSFASQEATIAAASAYDTQMAGAVARPSGQALIKGGLVVLVTGILCAMAGAFLPFVLIPSDYDRIVNDAVPVANYWKAPLMWGGSGLLSLGVLLWSLGQVVRAIFFLPGRQVTRYEIEGLEQPVQGAS